ncbi:MAG: hypothetical protein LBD24_01085, partial [Spirochaetaceae bacterium]|nr:hypothetical protein [Spirochaetaceae bacterium]
LPPSPTVLNSFLRRAPNNATTRTTRNTHGSRTATGGAKRSRALTAANPLTGQGVAPLGNNRRPC